MENLEEVLQALDEFQKMRPTEIPRELEDYLCWVAKTGDPVYQWSLIKTLFREKLTRVMTDFYESCPSLELAPCPNVEHFNYDTMKSNLLERLESFANAPFTVQRICELLTAPRKEYNRVDKFMRAIEKNILVVSTKEPGPIARRSENGDGMVNGSVDEDVSVTQPPQDVEMEYWEKDCPSTVTISVHTVENETPLLHTVLPTTTVVKNVFGSEENCHEKLESASSKDMPVPTFIPTTSEFSGVPGLTAQPQTQDPTIAPTMQNLANIVPEASGIVGDVREAIMNEDTSSQPSLDLENDEGEASDSTKKLQTTFQSKDFTSSESKSPKFYLDNAKLSDKVDNGAALVEAEEEPSKINEILDKAMDPVSKESMEEKESVCPAVENLLKSNGKLENVEKSDSEAETIETVMETPVTHPEGNVVSLENDSAESISASSSSENSEESRTPPPIALDDSINRIPPVDICSKEGVTPSTDMNLDMDDSKGRNTDELKEDSKPIVEEPSCKETNTVEDFNSDQEKGTITITEAVEEEEEEGRVIKTMVPDPIPIIEEPKEADPSDKVKNNSSIVELPEESKNSNFIASCQDSEDKLMPVENSLSEPQSNNVDEKEKDNSIEGTPCKRIRETEELMEVDDEETLSMFQQDEPMEQETTESKS